MDVRGWLSQPRALDGALGTELYRRGLSAGTPVESWVLERPWEIEAVHRAHVAAGAEVLLTATFGGNRARLAPLGLLSQEEKIHSAAVAIARRAAAGEALVAGDIGPTGHARRLEEDEAAEVFAAQARLLLAAGVDLVWIETISSLGELRAAVTGARRAGAEGLVATISPRRDLDSAEAARFAAGAGLDATGINCGSSPASSLRALEAMAAASPGLPLVAKPSTGAPPGPALDPEAFGAWAGEAWDRGARLIGGCCGASPEHLRAARDAVRGRQARARAPGAQAR